MVMLLLSVAELPLFLLVQSLLNYSMGCM